MFGWSHLRGEMSAHHYLEILLIVIVDDTMAHDMGTIIFKNRSQNFDS